MTLLGLDKTLANLAMYGHLFEEIRELWDNMMEITHD
jgi:hypothetical protein